MRMNYNSVESPAILYFLKTQISIEIKILQKSYFKNIKAKQGRAKIYIKGLFTDDSSDIF